MTVLNRNTDLYTLLIIMKVTFLVRLFSPKKRPKIPPYCILLFHTFQNYLGYSQLLVICFSHFDVCEYYAIY